MLLVPRARFSFQNQCISMFPSNCFQSWFCIVCWRAVRLKVTAVPFLFYSGKIKAQTLARTNLAAAVQQACLCYYRWWMCAISSIPLNRRRPMCRTWLATGFMGFIWLWSVDEAACMSGSVCKYIVDHFAADLGHTKDLLTFKSWQIRQTEFTVEKSCRPASLKGLCVLAVY